MTPPDGSLETVVEHARSSDESVRVSDLLEAARDAGLPAGEAWRATVEACDAGAVQESWVDWERVPDQAELALRLRVLGDAPQLLPDLDDFLLFFFRASAPELYRHAALAIGRHSWNHPALLEGLRAYADQREIAFGEPVPLNGDRSRRRLLLASTARYLHGPAGETPPTFPIAVEPMAALREAPTPDISVLALCCEQVLDADRGDEAFRGMCWEIAESIHDFLGESGSQRGLVRTWGQMTAALERLAPERTAAIWSETLPQFERRDDRTYAEHLATYWEFDAALLATVDGDSRFLDRIDADEIGALFDSADFRWLARIRRWHWHIRHGREAPEPPSAPEAARDAADPELAAFHEMVVDRTVAGDELRRAIHGWIASRLEAVTDPARWWARPDESRALLSFLLLDAVRHRPPPREAIRQLFNRAGISRTTPGEAVVPEAEGVAGMPWEGFHDLLWQIYRIEGAPTDFPVESESITSISTAERLLGFIRAGQAVRDLDILADALEHFLRLELASDPEFDPRGFLYRIAARKPHPSLFRELSRRTRGRTYATEAGGEVDLRQMLDPLADPTATDDWFPELSEVRQSLRAVVSHDDLHDALNAFADQVDPRIPDAATHHRGLVDLLLQTIPDDNPILLDSTAEAATTSPEELTARVAEQTRLLRQMTGELFDGPDLELADMHRAARNVSSRLANICDRLSPCIAAADGELLREVTSRLDARIADWTTVLETGLDTPLEQVSWPLDDSGRGIFDQLRAVTADLESSAMRTRAFRIAYEWLERRHPATAGGAPETEPPLDDPDYWQFERDLLAVAATTTRELDLGPEWLDFLTDRWERLASVAMDLQAEPHAVDLVRADEFARLRRRARTSVTVERLEQWLADRYHLPALAALTADLRPDDRRSPPPMAAATGRLVGNFTHVWLALLVGAVMLLDFGDAWVELARMGDIPGIAATFGIGLGGTFLYLLADILRKTDSPFDQPPAGRLLRIVSFLLVCFAYTVLVTGGLWYLFSATDLVLHGDGATLHILVWTGFALFVGVFFGLLTDAG